LEFAALGLGAAQSGMFVAVLLAAEFVAGDAMCQVLTC